MSQPNAPKEGRALVRVPAPARPIQEVVYVVGAEGLDTVKIGTSTDVGKRIRRMQTRLPLTLSVLWTCEGGRSLESALHSEFQAYKQRGEWFDLTPLGDPVSVVREAVRRHAPRLGLPLPPVHASPNNLASGAAPVLEGCVEIERTISARPAAPQEAERLGYPAGIVLLVTVLTAVQRDAAGKPMAVTETVTFGPRELPEAWVPPVRGGEW